MLPQRLIPRAFSPLLWGCFICLLGCTQPPAADTGLWRENLQQTLNRPPITASAAANKTPLGLSLIPRNYDASRDGWSAALHTAETLGLEVLQLPSGYWREDQPSENAYDWQATEHFFSALANFPDRFEIAQDFGGPFFHDQSTAPAHLQPIQLTDQAFANHYMAYLRSYLTRFGAKIHRLLIHAEGSYSYFKKHPDHLPHYAKLLRQARAEIHTGWPHIKLGVNIDPNNSPEVLQAIASEVDFVGFDMVLVDDVLETPAQLTEVVAYVLQHTENKPVSLMCNWSSAGRNGSDAAQVRFIDAAFAELEKHQTRLAYVAFGPPFSEDKSVVGPAYRAQFDHLPATTVNSIIGWITQLGFIRTDGTPKPAFNRLYERSQQYHTANEAPAATDSKAR